MRLELTWDGELRFAGRCEDLQFVLDSAGQAGPSPMQALGFALAGCMAMDLVNILGKGRHSLTGLKAAFTGIRAESDPRRFTRMGLHFKVEGKMPAHAIERAIVLSRERYCSVWSSLRRDIGFDVTFEILQPPA